jgi:hypothetical protein
MAAQHQPQPKFFADFDGTQLHGMLVVVVSGEGVAQNIGDASGHARAQIHSGGAEHHDHSGGHIFAPVLAYAFHHSERAAVAYRKSFARASRDVEFAGGRTIEDRVTDQDVATLGSFVSRGDRDSAAAETLADIVVGFTQQTKLQAGNQEGSEALSRCAGELAGDDAGHGGAGLPRSNARRWRGRSW